MEEKSQNKVEVGNISGVSGQVNIAGRDVNANQYAGASTDQISQAFAAMYEKVSAMPDGPDKTIAQSAVEALETEAKQGEDAEESKVQKWLSFLAETAPDVFEVAVATFTNPPKGVGLVFKKIAERVKAEKGA